MLMLLPVTRSQGGTDRMIGQDMYVDVTACDWVARRDRLRWCNRTCMYVDVTAYD